MFSKLYITIKASDKFDDSIIDPISFILIDWGVDGNLIDWDIYPSRAKLEINTENDNYQTYSITYQGMQTIMELCYECELCGIFKIISYLSNIQKILLNNSVEQYLNFL